MEKGAFFMSILSERIREEFKTNDDRRDAGLVTPDSVIRYDDLAYGNDEKWQILDVYRPKSRAMDILPVIISVHGGGWVYGDKERYQFYCMELAKRGFGVINFTYRLAPEFKYPAPLEDVNLVAKWVMEHGARYKLDTSQVFGVGDSAGAQILGTYAAICTNPEFASHFSFRVPSGLRFCAIALNCGPYKITITEPKDLAQQLLCQEYLPQHGSEEELHMISVTEHVTEHFPPTFLMTAEADFLRDYAPAMKDRLEQFGVPYVYRVYGDKTNPLEHVFHCDVKTEDAAKCNDDECAFFRSYCTN